MKAGQLLYPEFPGTEFLGTGISAEFLGTVYHYLEFPEAALRLRLALSRPTGAAGPEGAAGEAFQASEEIHVAQRTAGPAMAAEPFRRRRAGLARQQARPIDALPRGGALQERGCPAARATRPAVTGFCST